MLDGRQGISLGNIAIAYRARLYVRLEVIGVLLWDVTRKSHVVPWEVSRFRVRSVMFLIELLQRNVRLDPSRVLEAIRWSATVDLLDIYTGLFDILRRVVEVLHFMVLYEDSRFLLLRLLSHIVPLILHFSGTSLSWARVSAFRSIVLDAIGC